MPLQQLYWQQSNNRNFHFEMIHIFTGKIDLQFLSRTPLFRTPTGTAEESLKQREFEIIVSKWLQMRFKGNGFDFKIEETSKQPSSK